MADGKTIRVTMRRSAIGGTDRQRGSLAGLGLTRIGRSRELVETPEVLGMIRKVEHLIDVEPGTGSGGGE